MSKSSKTAFAKRVEDTARLILAGAEFADIKQYAIDHGWNVGDRQVRRYLKEAYQSFAKVLRRKHRQLLGRHIMQRRALYARALQAGQFSTGLQILRDEAALQRLYPKRGKVNETAEVETTRKPPLNCRERLARLLRAKATNDRSEIAIIQHITPSYWYGFEDTLIPELQLQIMAMTYVCEQLDAAGMVLIAMLNALNSTDDIPRCAPLFASCAYRFRIGHEAWKLFAARFGVNGEQLVRDNYLGHFLEFFTEQLCGLSPTIDEIKEAFAAAGMSDCEFFTAEELAADWERMIDKVCAAPESNDRTLSEMLGSNTKANPAGRSNATPVL